ncbi:helix-turn-helix domain-containing protein [Sphingomonas mali]|uniref:helix-turn-helix domain-containing protein n=1 Tax=Sphingomonas mali TaxID=40682 RepID=UPI0008376E64|nr:helix-turn-helix domain-containing protein [Sphingomonas mali]
MTEIGRPTPEAARATIEPISVRIPDAVRMTGLSRSRIYQLIATGDVEAAKVGRSTVVLVASLRALVLANRKVPRRKA